MLFVLLHFICLKIIILVLFLFHFSIFGFSELFIFSLIQFSSVTQSCPTLCDPMNRSTPGLPVHHQLLESTKTMSIEWVMPPILPIFRVFSSESPLCIRWPKYWNFSFSISPSNEHPGLISFRMDWFIVCITVSLVVRAISLD